jgi:hypothetical protein
MAKGGFESDLSCFSEAPLVCRAEITGGLLSGNRQTVTVMMAKHGNINRSQKLIEFPYPSLRREEHRILIISFITFTLSFDIWSKAIAGKRPLCHRGDLFINYKSGYRFFASKSRPKA